RPAGENGRHTAADRRQGATAPQRSGRYFGQGKKPGGTAEDNQRVHQQNPNIRIGKENKKRAPTAPARTGGSLDDRPQSGQTTAHSRGPHAQATERRAVRRASQIRGFSK